MRVKLIFLINIKGKINTYTTQQKKNHKDPVLDI